MANLKETYAKEIVPALEKKLGVTNPMLVPRLTKIVINMAFGIQEKDVQKQLVQDLEAITGQKAVLCKARKSISNFKLREGMPIGAKVTLRGVRMYEFAERFFNVTLPRIRDFRGVPNRGFDKAGNYTMGMKEYVTFPEITAVSTASGLDITFVTTAKDKDGAKALLEALGMAFMGR
ncbi:MAG TPA: 50S ribosomal protein L5 [Candidatus Spyradenecus faecavium]|uniref:Large ribosomal subunit protein uL5 n=1 Tax=Candidatus Spyradenecus faecavium TaxID=2840947 RepID=A0A9D1NLZ4_9BACT|nr:50S ribosomal protein L5 [Candidatus Spyradenecus faecavium]